MRQERAAFEWDEGNESELARHHITPEEVEQVFDNDPAWASNKRNRPGNRLMIGTTNSGRVLTIVVRIVARARANPGDYRLGLNPRRAGPLPEVEHGG